MILMQLDKISDFHIFIENFQVGPFYKIKIYLKWEPNI